MKPGKNDVRYKIRIDGLELNILQRLTLGMSDDFGLGDKINAYKGTREITFYSWDLDCLEAVMESAMSDPAAEGITSVKELAALVSLNARLRVLIDASNADL